MVNSSGLTRKIQVFFQQNCLHCGSIMEGPSQQDQLESVKIFAT